MARSVEKAVLAGLSAALVCHGAGGAAPADESLLQRLYRLVRPAAKPPHRLSDFLTRATQRSGDTQTLPRVLLVNQRTGSSTEWVRGRGAVEPLICSDGLTLVMRRGDKVQTSTVTQSETAPPSLSPPQTLVDLVVRQLFACTRAIDGGTGLDLWFESADGVMKTIALQAVLVKPADIPPGLASATVRESALTLRRIQSLREDGLSAMVRDGQLVLEREDGTNGGAPRTLALPMPVEGDPAWIGGGDWLIVTGLQD